MKLFLYLGLLSFSLTGVCEDVWIQQQNLKALGDIGISFESWSDSVEDIGTEFFLTCKPECGTSFKVHGRDFIFHDLPAGQDQRLLTKNFQDFLAKKISQQYPQHSSAYWEKFVGSDLRIGTGSNMKEAFIALKLQEFKMDFPTWKKKTLELRKLILQKTSGSLASFDDVLEASRRYGRKPSELTAWLKNNNLPHTLVPEISEYGRLLTLSDYLPPQESVHPTYVNFLEKTKSAKKYLVVDIVGLGVINRKSQDQWLISGADISKLDTVEYEGGKRIQDIKDRVVEILGPEYDPKTFRYYVSGDGLGFDVSSVSQEKLGHIQSWMKDHPWFYGTVVDVKASGIEGQKQAIESAVDDVNELKSQRMKKTMFNQCLRMKLQGKFNFTLKDPSF
jgi:hypothetical protein